MPPRLPSLGGSPAKATPLPSIQPASPRLNVTPQGSPGTLFGSSPAPAQDSQGEDQVNSGTTTRTDIRAGAQPFEPPFPGDVYNGPIGLKTLALSEDGAFERLAASLETLSRKNFPELEPPLGNEDLATSAVSKMPKETPVILTASESREGGFGGGSSGPSTALGDASKNAVHVLKRLENRRVNLGQTYMVTVKEAYECLKETEHILEDYHSQVGAQIFEQLSTFIKALDADFKTLQGFFEKEKEEQKKQDEQLYQKVDQASSCALATEKAVTDAGTKISSLLDALKQKIEEFQFSLDEVGKQLKKNKDDQETELFKKVDQASISAAAAVMANSETKISELLGKIENSINTLEIALDSKFEAASLNAAESQTSVFQSTLDGFQKILNGLSDNIQILATQGSATAAVLTLQNRLTELQNQQQTVEEQFTENWTQKLNILEEQLKAQAERIKELEKPSLKPTSIQNWVQSFDTDSVEPNGHPALKLAVGGNCFLPHLHYHRHRIGVDWEISAGLNKGAASFENFLQNRWFIGLKIEPFVSLALQTFSSCLGVPDGRGHHISRKFQIQNFHYIREIGETENQPYSRVEIGWDFGPIWSGPQKPCFWGDQTFGGSKNGSLVIPVNLGGYWLEESIPSPNSFDTLNQFSVLESFKSLGPGLASDFAGAMKSVPTFWRFFSKTDWYVSSGAALDTKYWHNSVNFPIGVKIHGTIQLKAPGNRESVKQFVQTNLEGVLEKTTEMRAPVVKGTGHEYWAEALSDRLLKFETKVESITHKVENLEPKIGSLSKKNDCIETMLFEQKARQTNLETRLQNQETLVADYEKRFIVQKAEQEKCCQKVFKKFPDLEKKSAGEKESFENQSTESPLDWASTSKTLLWVAAVEGCFGFIQGFGFGFLYLFLLRQQLRTTNLFEKNLYRTARFFIPAGYFAGIFVSLGMITINFFSGIPLETKWPLFEKSAEVLDNFVKKVPGHETRVGQKLNKVVFYGMSYGLPFVSVTKLFHSHLGSQTPHTTVLMCIRLSVSFVLFSKITSWWTTWLISDSELERKKEEQDGTLLPQLIKHLESDDFFGAEWTSFCLEIFAVDPLESPTEFSCY